MKMTNLSPPPQPPSPECIPLCLSRSVAIRSHRKNPKEGGEEKRTAKSASIAVRANCHCQWIYFTSLPFHSYISLPFAPYPSAPVDTCQPLFTLPAKPVQTTLEFYKQNFFFFLRQTPHDVRLEARQANECQKAIAS